MIKQKQSMFKIFLTVDKHQRFKFFISQATPIRLEHSSSNAESSFVITVEFDTSRELEKSDELGEVTRYANRWKLYYRSSYTLSK